MHIETVQQKPLYTEFTISHNYITRAGLQSVQTTLPMSGCFLSTGLISGGSELHMKVINGVSFLKSTLRRPEWMTTPDKVKQTAWPIRFNPQSCWNSHAVHTRTLHTHQVRPEPSRRAPSPATGRIHSPQTADRHRCCCCVSLFTSAGDLQTVCAAEKQTGARGEKLRLVQGPVYSS